jgi:hypothetical protein
VVRVVYFAARRRRRIHGATQMSCRKRIDRLKQSLAVEKIEQLNSETGELQHTLRTNSNMSTVITDQQNSPGYTAITASSSGAAATRKSMRAFRPVRPSILPM